MISNQLKRRLINSASSLMNKYDMFFTNRQYSKIHFRTEEEYISIQKSLATEIQLEENTTKDCLIKYFDQNFPKLKLIFFDSRPICLSEKHHKLGKCLFQNISNNINEQNEIKRTFQNDTDFTLDIDRFEDLSQEEQQKIMEFYKNGK